MHFASTLTARGAVLAQDWRAGRSWQPGRAAQGAGVAVDAGTFRFELLVDHGGTPTDGRDTNVAGP